MGATQTSTLNSNTNSNDDDLIEEEDSCQSNNFGGKFNSRSRKTTSGKDNATPLVEVQNNSISTRQRSRGKGLRDGLGVDSAIENVVGGEKPPKRRSNRIKAKNLQGLLEKENKYNINTSEFVVLEDVNCALNLSELPKQKRASKRRFVPDCGTQPRINKRICVQNSNVVRSLTENSSVNKKDTSDAVLGRQTMKESEVMPSNDLAQRPSSSVPDTAETGINSVLNNLDKMTTMQDCVPNSGAVRSPTAKSSVNKEDMIDAVLGRRNMEESQVARTNDPLQRPPFLVTRTEAVETGGNSVPSRSVEMTAHMHVVSDDDRLPDGLFMEDKSSQKCQANNNDGHSTGITMAKVKKWYSKLHTKYKELKARKVDDVEAYIEEQNKKFTAYVNAAEELLEHLRNENNHLRSEVNEVNSMLALNRVRQLEHKNAVCQNDLLVERSKNLALIKEVKRLRLLLSEQENMSKQDQSNNLSCQENSTQCFSFYEGTHSFSQEKSVVLQPEGHESIVDLSCTGSDTFLKRFPSYSRLKEASVQTEMDQNISLSCCLERKATVEEQEKRLLCNEAARKSTQVSSQVDFEYAITQVDKRSREDIVKGDAANEGCVRANRLFQTLLQCMVGLKFTIAEEGNQLQLSILQESSGYSFKLKCLSVEDDPHFGENGELLYQTVSLGTLQKIAPAWMKEDIIFSVGQVNIFFDRILQVTNGRGHNLLVR